ncbi:hypothetical protein K439DRAFT_1348747, partial [Ramaria rubella]
SNPDVIVCIDGCFQHCRYSSVLDDPHIIDLGGTFIFVDPEIVQEAKEHVVAQHNVTLPSHCCDSCVPSRSLDECEKSHHAVCDCSNDNTKRLYASKGLMAMVFCHDIPLFFCDITMPGKQQFYAIALIRQLAAPTATIGLLYDITCMLDRSIAKHDLIPKLASWLSCGTAVFHAYTHQFCCQIVYHPRK